MNNEIIQISIHLRRELIFIDLQLKSFPIELKLKLREQVVARKVEETDTLRFKLFGLL